MILIGDPTVSAAATIHPQWQDLVVDLGGNRTGSELLKGLLAGIDEHAAVVTVGNIHGQGEVLLHAIDGLHRHRAEASTRLLKPVQRNRSQGLRGDLFEPPPRRNGRPR